MRMAVVNLATVGVLCAALTLGCGSAVDGPGGGKASEGSTGTGTQAGSTGTATQAGSTGTATQPDSAEVGVTVDPQGSSGAENFLSMPDLPASGAACDPWHDSCPAGQKCRPLALTPGPWTEAKCVPINEPPTPTGGTCMDFEWEATDECEQGAACFGFFGDEGGRRCHEVCSGSATEPTCSDACSFCSVIGDGVAGVCLFSCDPRAPACPEGQSCYSLAEAPRFMCALGTGPSAAGESCTTSSDCTQGTACVEAALVPGCSNSKCCAPVCDLSEPDLCAKALPGTACALWPVSGPDFEPSCVPPKLGLCSAA